LLTIKFTYRRNDSNKFHEEVVAGHRKYVEVKSSPPYPAEDTKAWLLGKDKRLGAPPSAASPTSAGPQGDLFNFKPPARSGTVTQAMEQTLVGAVGKVSGASSVGVDVEDISNPCFLNSTFLERNYTAQERAALSLKQCSQVLS